MTDKLKAWLQENVQAICRSTLRRAPNLLPDDQDIFDYIILIKTLLSEPREKQIVTIQHWILTSVGQDAPAARDWITILRVLKDEISQKLEQQFTAQDALWAWRDMDSIFTQTLIEASQIASDLDRVQLLEHTIFIRRQLENLEKSKTNFIAIAAHELKTPLTIMEGYANLLRYELEPDSRLRLYIDGLDNGTQRMHEIISDMIDATMLDINRFELNYQNFQIDKLLEIVVERVNKHYHERKVRLILVPYPGELRFYGDPERLVQAFSKVVYNALKYTPDGGAVTISTAVTRQNEATAEIGGYVDIQIQDTGIGIAPENLETIFERFTSARDAVLHSSGKTKFKGGGPGLGLPIVKGIIEAHGGRVWAESQGYDEIKCMGSTFHLELPILLKAIENTTLEDE